MRQADINSFLNEPLKLGLQNSFGPKKLTESKQRENETFVKKFTK